MKKFIFSLFMATTCLMGCNELDLTPIDYAATGNYWQNEEQVATFMNGLHKHLRDDYTSPVVLGELRGGTLRDGTSSLGTSLDRATIVTSALTTTSTGITNWNSYYNKLLQLNHFIQEVENGCTFLSENSRNFYLGQAYGIRAYYYFMLYRTYGGVPLETEVKLLDGSVDPSAMYMERATAEQTMKFLKDEIGKSEIAFGSDNTLDRVTWSRFATLFLKAQIYLWSAKVNTNDYEGPHTATGNADLQIARQALEDIKSSGLFELENNFADIFAYDNKRNKEIILAMHFDKDEATNLGWGDYFLYSPGLFIGQMYDENGNLYNTDPLESANTGLLRYEYKESFVRTFDQEDTRRAATFFEYYTTADPATREMGVSMLKMRGHLDSDGSRYYDSDIIMFRYADVLLMMAEVENGLNGTCASYINDIRKRAYGNAYRSEFAYTDGSYAQNEMAILYERDKEFVGEGTRWFDIVRLHDANNNPLAFSAEANYPSENGGVASPVLKSNETYKLLWPVDVTVLNADELLEQTWGYKEAVGNTAAN